MNNLFKSALQSLGIVLTLTLTATSTASAQTPVCDDDSLLKHIEIPEPVQPKEEIFTTVELPPTFPGGESALYKFIGQELRYPASAAEKGIQGRVMVQFVIQKDGSIGQAKVVKSVDPELDKEALRIVRRFPKFVPGKMNGRAVNVWYTCPIRFKLPN